MCRPVMTMGLRTTTRRTRNARGQDARRGGTPRRDHGAGLCRPAPPALSSGLLRDVALASERKKLHVCAGKKGRERVLSCMSPTVHCANAGWCTDLPPDVQSGLATCANLSHNPHDWQWICARSGRCSATIPASQKPKRRIHGCRRPRSALLGWRKSSTYYSHPRVTIDTYLRDHDAKEARHHLAGEHP
jgi:hypothetical protein